MVLTEDILAAVLTQLHDVGATVASGCDDYGNPDITVKGADEYPVVARHSVIGGEEIVAIDAAGHFHKVPGPNGDPFGPIDDASTQIARLWEQVIEEFPKAAV